MNLLNDMGGREGEQIVVSFLLARHIAESLSAIVGLAEVVVLNHGAHSTI